MFQVRKIKCYRRQPPSDWPGEPVEIFFMSSLVTPQTSVVTIMPYARRMYPRPRTNRRSSYLGGVVQRRRRAVAASRLKLARPVRKLVDRRIGLQNPTKVMTYHLRRYQFSNLINDAPLTRLHTVIPDVAQGDERNDREGTKTKMTSLTIRGRISIPADDNPLYGNDDRAQIYVRMFVMSTKFQKGLSDVIAEWSGTYNPAFFKNNASTSAPTGNYIDMLSEVNHELFTVHCDKVFRLDRNYGYFPDPTSTSGAAPQRPASRDFFLKMRVKNKVLYYNNPGAVRPNNFQPFVCCLFAYGNGASPSTSAVPFIEYLSRMTFKDH